MNEIKGHQCSGSVCGRAFGAGAAHPQGLSHGRMNTLRRPSAPLFATDGEDLSDSYSDKFIKLTHVELHLPFVNDSDDRMLCSEFHYTRVIRLIFEKGSDC